MKRFLIITSILLLLSLVVSTATYFWVISQLPPADSKIDNESASELVATSSSVIDETKQESLPVVPPDGVPLRNLPLGDTQKSVLEKVGVDVETFVITSEMQTCAAEKLGIVRMNEIIAGEAPSIIETTRLLPCLGAE